MSGHLKAYLAEFIGTFALVFAAAAAACAAGLTPGSVSPLGPSLAYGSAYAVMAYAYGTVSGGQFNPALTLSLLLMRRIDVIKGVFYLVSQLLGAALAGQLLIAALHRHPEVASPPFLGSVGLTGVGFKAATLLEAVMTFFLVTAYYATAIDNRAKRGTTPLACGLALFAGVLVLGPLTGGALNPARAFGPSIVTGNWAAWYVYWAGPLAGALGAALLYEKLFLDAKK